MEMEHQRPVVTTDVEDLVELAHSVNTAAMELVVANLNVLDVNVVMMVVVENLAENVRPLKHVTVESVPEQPAEIVLAEFAVTTETEEAVVLVPLAKDAELDNASATMIAMREIVEMLLNQIKQTLVFALKDHVVPALQDSLVELMEDVQLFNNVPSVSQLLTVQPEEPLTLPRQLVFL